MTDVHGRAEPGFERVREAFAANFSKGTEVGAAFCVYKDGRPVVDIWGGVADEATGRPWEEDTTVLVFSTTKGATAVCANLLVQRGELDLDAPVVEYWPEFGAHGKDKVPVRWLLSHRAGVAAVPRGLTVEDVVAWDPVIDALADAEPDWPPGARHGYHALTYGWLVGEVVRRVSGETLGTFFRNEIAEPLGLDFWIGLPEAEEGRVAPLVVMPMIDFAWFPEHMRELLEAIAGPESLLMRSLGVGPFPPDLYNSRQVRAAEIPAANGVTTARSLARMYASLIGEVDGTRILSDATVAQARTTESEGPDAVLFVPMRFGLGFMLHGGFISMYQHGGFGHYGAGGSVGLAVPEAGLAIGYVMNRMDPGLTGDPRTQALFDAVRACV
ncbi:MAG TPA: serine hydrolase domain-containing protein [Acidimicrobiales bacterium]